MSDDGSITSLRRELCRAGAAHRRLGWGTIAWMGLVAVGVVLTGYAGEHLVLVIGCGPFGSHSQPAGPGWTWFLHDHTAELAGMAGTVLTTLAAFLVAFPRLRRRRLRPKIRALTPDQVQRLYQSLPATDRASRRLLAPLLREVGLPTELSPAVAPDARGAEPSPAEKAQ